MTIFRSFGWVFLLAVAVIFYMSTFIVDEREKKLVLRFGEIYREVKDPGLYFKLPIADEVVKVEDRIVAWESDDKSVQVVDNRYYQVDAVTFARVIDAKKFRETVGADLSRARARIETRLDSALRQTYGRRSFEAALSADRPVMMREIRDQVKDEALALGIQLVDVRIRRTDLMQNVLESTYERMGSERLAAATNLRSKGEAMNVQIKAKADREYTEKVANAKRDSEIIRGIGDADRNKIFAEAFSKDPEFFAFYRSMQAYSKSLGSSGTTLVLQPNSEFFKYFGAGDVTNLKGQ